jgi:hypothetical protein
MQVRATRSEQVQVEVDPVDVLEQMHQKWLSKQRGQYLKDGRWYNEEWTSHSYEVDRGEALPEQIEIDNAFRALIKLAVNTR